jgi:ribonucleotide reductase beta subunit family protein with ferritin-like domain
MKLINFQNKSKFRTLFEKSKENYWVPETVDCVSDKNQWAAMSKDEKLPILNLLQYAILLDSYQVTNLAEMSTKVEDPMLKAVLSFHGLMESVHSQSYSYYAETVMSKKEREFLYSDSPELQSRLNGFLNLKEIAGELVANYFLEGISFQALFRLSDILKAKSKLSGLAAILNLIKRDEDLHIETFQYQLKIEDVKLTAWSEAVESEAKLVLQLTNHKDVADYLHYASYLRLKAIGSKASKVVNPMKNLEFINDTTKSKLKQNFFTGNVVYSARNESLDWEVNNWF